MSRRNGCGNSIDDCNKSQPVCPAAENQLVALPQTLIIRAKTEQTIAESVHIAALRGVCLHCGGAAEGGSFRVCANCGNSWRVNHCLSCGVPSTAAIQKHHNAPTAGGLSAINAAHAVVMPVVVKPYRKGAEYYESCSTPTIFPPFDMQPRYRITTRWLSIPVAAVVKEKRCTSMLATPLLIPSGRSDSG